jgi:molecular chaperone Hsp33
MQKTMNKLIKALIYGGNVSLSVLDTTKMVNDAIKIHSLNESSAVTLGNLLTSATYMAGCLKSDRGAISITIKGGEAGTASVSGDKDLHIRGYIDGNADGKLHGGTLTVIKEDGFYRPFVGTCELVGNDVSQNLMQYFYKSEQIDTAVSFGVKIKDGKCVSSGGIVMQMLPGFSEEDMDAAEEKMQHFVNPAEVIEKFGADGIITEFFGDLLGGCATYEYFPEYKCNCSRKKIEGVIMPLGREELLKIIDEEGKVSVHCHYCNTDYVFGREDVEKLFKK